MTTTTIRYALTLLLLVGVYGETGVWTTLTLFFVCVSNELTAFVLKRKQDKP